MTTKSPGFQCQPSPSAFPLSRIVITRGIDWMIAVPIAGRTKCPPRRRGFQSGPILPHRFPKVEPGRLFETIAKVARAVDGRAFEERPENRLSLVLEHKIGDVLVLPADLRLVFVESRRAGAENRKVYVDQYLLVRADRHRFVAG